jgi:hypothetical protein
MKKFIKKILQIAAAILSLMSGMFWHLSALAQSTLADIQSHPLPDPKQVIAFSATTTMHNVWAAETAAAAGVCAFLLLIFDDE